MSGSDLLGSRASPGSPAPTAVGGEPAAETGQFQTAVPSTPRAAGPQLWSWIREQLRPVGGTAAAVPDGTLMEDGVAVVASLAEAPPRTIQNVAIKRASPMSAAVRAMIERREFGRRHDATRLDLAPVRALLPGLETPVGPVEFIASDGSPEDLDRSVDCLLQHRKQLVAATMDAARPRSSVLVLGGGPSGLMAAIQLRLRDHRVVLVEQREVYTRNRFIGVYKPVAHLMAALGMPERMTYDFTHYRGKRGLMLADIQTFLHGIALKLGVVVYTGAVAPDLSTLRDGELELQRSMSGGDGDGAAAIGMTRWYHDSVAKVGSGVSIRFDTIVEATGGRSGLRELLVGVENVVPLRTVGRDAALRDPSLDSYFDLPEDHSAQFVESNYGCPPAVRRAFAKRLIADDPAIPNELPGLVANIDASILVKPVEEVPRKPGVGARIGDDMLDIPRDWVLVHCPLPDQRLTRYQMEGPLPQSFEYDGRQVPTSECLDELNPVTLLVRLLYAMGVPFDAVDRRRLIEFYTQENSRGDASDIVAAFVGSFRGVRIGGERPLWRGQVPGAPGLDYAIIGEALQNAWYRFGVGVDDSFAAADHLAEGTELAPEARSADALRFERVMTARSVQVLYHLFLVNQNIGQGVVGPVLTEAYMDRRHRTDLAEARLREEKRHAVGMAAALADLCDGAPCPLLEAAVEHRRDHCCRAVLGQLAAFDYDPQALAEAARAMRLAKPGWRAAALAALAPNLSAPHLELLQLLAGPPAAPDADAPAKAREERLSEISLGRYEWATPWVRACALRALDPAHPASAEVLRRARSETVPLVAETAALALGEVDGNGVSTTIDKVVLLKGVSLFSAIPHEELVEIAYLLTDRRARAGERIFAKGEYGDCLYVIAAGAVRVSDGARVLAELGPAEYFGELSLLDAEARAASVEATQASHLLRLEQHDFYALIASRPQILHAINHELCQMVRETLKT